MPKKLRQTLLKPHALGTQLPQEIVQEILEWNGDSDSELFTYSFVSKAWLAASRRILCRAFSFTEIYSIRTWDKLFSSTPELANFVREVWVEPRFPWEFREVRQGERMHNMPCVEEIEWAPRYNQSTKATTDIQWFLGHFPNIKRVWVGGLFEDIEHLKALLGYCGPIRELCLEDDLRFYWPRSDLSVHIPTGLTGFNLVELRHLEISDQPGRNLDWVFFDLVRGSLSNLCSLTIGDEGISLTALCLLLQEACATLVDFKLGTGARVVASKKRHRYLPSPGTFPPLPLLRILTFETISLSFTPMQTLDWISTEFFSVFQAPLLTTFEIVLFTFFPAQIVDFLECYHWRQFINAVVNKFTVLEELVVCICMKMEFGHKWRAKLETLVQRYVYLPRILGSRKVRIEWDVYDTEEPPYPDDPLPEE